MYNQSPDKETGLSHIDRKKAREEEKKREEDKKRNELCKSLEVEFYNDLKSWIETQKSQVAIKNFAKLIVSGNSPEEDKSRQKLLGFKYAYAEIIRSSTIPDKCSKTNFIKIAKELKGGKHCSHEHND